MAPIKFEEHIKNKLDKRTIKPSADAWDKLSARLDENSESKNNKAFWLLGIAASVVGVLLVVTQFFKTNGAFHESPNNIVTPKVEKLEHIDKVATESIIEHKEALKEKPTVIKPKNKVATNKSVEKKKPVNTVIAAIAPKKDPLKKEQLTKEPAKVSQNDMLFEEQKIQNIVALALNVKDSNGEVTDELIDALLLEAQKEINLQKMIDAKTGVVDADLLLQNVEAELDQSFREKVFKALKDSFVTVKTAVAQRND